VQGAFGETPAEAPFYYGYFAQEGDRSFFAREFGDNLTFVVLDSGHTRTHDSQVPWLDESLAQYPDRVKMAIYHVPLYPSHRGFNETYSVQGRTHWLPLFDTHELTVAFENHDHTMKRTKRLRGNAVDPEGTLYLGDGCMGIDPRAGNQAGAWYLERVESKQHFWLVDIPAYEDETSPEMTFTAIDTEGAQLDQTTLAMPARPPGLPACGVGLQGVLGVFLSVLGARHIARLA